ncbi:MAG: CBS domain-containing protein [bacterium]|nr:CBS domain-containing protein [bacterium]
MMRYAIITIYTNEDAHWRGKPLSRAVVDRVAGLGLAARCMVTRGQAGCYENGEIASTAIEALAYNLPVKIEIAAPAAELDQLLPLADEMVGHGLVTVDEVDARFHRTRSLLLPRHLKVRDIMTSSPRCVSPGDTLADAARLMLDGGFNGAPVVDDERRPIGMITQGDLLSRGGFPIRLGLLAELASGRVDELLGEIAIRPASEIMSAPVISTRLDADVSGAVDLMLTHSLKRLPVVDEEGRLCGMLSRVDVFKAVMVASPDWKALSNQNVEVGGLRYVRDVMRRDMLTVSPDDSIESILKIIDENELRRAAVVDAEGKLAGLISDRDLFALLSEQQARLWPMLISKIPLLKSAAFYDEIVRAASLHSAADVMKTDLVVIDENAPIQDAIALMTAKKLKRLPVVDENGRFRGMIGRDSVLRAGAGAE